MKFASPVFGQNNFCLNLLMGKITQDISKFSNNNMSQMAKHKKKQSPNKS